ncbi:MAG: hypothetical protein WA160_11445 [Pseudobdellovibrio sp.]
MKSFKNNKIIQSNKGQGLIEYLILVSIIAVGTLGVVRVVGQNVGTHYENINRALGAKKADALTILNADDKLLKKKDLSTFMDGAR